MAATVGVIVATTAMLLVPACADDLQNNVIECQDNQTIKASVTQPGSVLKLKCQDTYNIAPTCSPTVKTVYTDSSCEPTKTLAELCPGATGTQDSGDNKPVELTFPQLPVNSTTFYFKCDKSSGKPCKFAVTVSAASPQGPQVCAVKNTTVMLAIKGEGDSARFACGKDFILHPEAAGKVYSEDCETEKDLKDLTRSALVDSYYTLKATKTPSDRTLCYVCGSGPYKKGKGENTCAVLVSVSAGSNSAALSALGLALPCTLALLHFT